MAASRGVPTRRPDRIRVRQVILVLLSLNSGATDAVGFVALGGAFTSVMTGNMILLGISATNAVPGVATRSGLPSCCSSPGHSWGRASRESRNRTMPSDRSR